MRSILRHLLVGLVIGIVGFAGWLALVLISSEITGLPSNVRTQVPLTPDMTREAIAFVQGSREGILWYEYAVLPGVMGLLIGLLTSRLAINRIAFSAGAILILLLLLGFNGGLHVALIAGSSFFLFGAMGVRGFIQRPRATNAKNA